MPRPLCYMQLDASGEYMLAEARERSKKKTDIQPLKYFADPRGDIRANNLKEWERLIRDFEYAVRNFRSVLLDTATEALDVRKLAEYGRNTQIKSLWYGPIYSDFRWMVKEARKHDANVLFVHRVKDEYVNDARTGNDVLDGWQKIVYEAQVYIEHGRDENNFTTTIMECEQNALVTGMTFSSDEEDNDFPNLAAKVFGNDPDDWR